MNYALIFAGGTGTRMKSDLPKQFIEIKNKPILVHTLEVFENTELIDKILIVCLKEYVEYTKSLIAKYRLKKVIDIIPGGKSAFESQRLGISFLKDISINKSDLVFVHDGVRPLIDKELIKKCYQTVISSSSAIVVSPASETIAMIDDNKQIIDTVPRQSCMLARAPQVFYLQDLFKAHKVALESKKEYIDSASMMLDQGFKLSTVEGPAENIKITTQYDLTLCKLWMEEHE